jgi:hypothetical protein
MSSIDSILKKQLQHLSSLDDNTTTIADAIQYIEISLNETNRFSGGKSDKEIQFEERFAEEKQFNNSMKMIDLLSEIKDRIESKPVLKDNAPESKPKEQPTNKPSGKYDVDKSDNVISSLFKKSAIGNLSSLKKFATNVIGVKEDSKLGKYLSNRESFKDYIKEAKRINPKYNVKEDPRYNEFKTSSVIKQIGTKGLSFGSNENIQKLADIVGLKDVLLQSQNVKETHLEYAQQAIEQNPELLKDKKRSDVEKDLIKESKMLLNMKQSYNELFDKLNTFKDLPKTDESNEVFKTLSEELSSLRKQIEDTDKTFVKEEPVKDIPSQSTPVESPIKKETVESKVQDEIKSLSDSIKESSKITTVESKVQDENKSLSDSIKETSKITTVVSNTQDEIKSLSDSIKESSKITTVVSNTQDEIKSLSDSIKETSKESTNISNEVSESQIEDNLQKSKTFDVLQNQLNVQTEIFKLLKMGKFGVNEKEESDTSLLGGLFGGNAKKEGGKLKNKAKSFGKSTKDIASKIGGKFKPLSTGVKAIGGATAAMVAGSSIGNLASNVVNGVKESTVVGKMGGVVKSVGGKVLGGVGNKLKGSASALIGTSIAKRLPAAMGGMLGKSIPLIGAALGVGEGISRLVKGDIAGAGLAAVSGLGSVATAVPAAIALLANDVYEDVYGISPMSDPLVGERMTEIKKNVEEEATKFINGKSEEPKPVEPENKEIPKIEPVKIENKIEPVPEFSKPEIDLTSLSKAPLNDVQSKPVEQIKQEQSKETPLPPNEVSIPEPVVTINESTIPSVESEFPNLKSEEPIVKPVGVIQQVPVTVETPLPPNEVSIPEPVVTINDNPIDEVVQLANQIDPLIGNPINEVKNIVNQNIQSVTKPIDDIINPIMDIPSSIDNKAEELLNNIIPDVTINGERIEPSKIIPIVNSSITDTLSNMSIETKLPIDVTKIEPIGQALFKTPEKPIRDISNALYENSAKTETARLENTNKNNVSNGNNIVNAPTNVNNNSTTVISKTVKNDDNTVLNYFQNRFNFNG